MIFIEVDSYYHEDEDGWEICSLENPKMLNLDKCYTFGLIPDCYQEWNMNSLMFHCQDGTKYCIEARSKTMVGEQKLLSGQILSVKEIYNLLKNKFDVTSKEK